MRLFIGIPLASEVVDVIGRLSRSLQSAGDGLRWSSSESWHVTLAFHGKTSEEKYACLVERLRGVRSPRVPFQIGGSGFSDRAGVFFADVRVSSELLQLEKRVLGATSNCGFAAENRPFHPHVTLARAKGDNALRALKGLQARANTTSPFPAFPARE